MPARVRKTGNKTTSIVTRVKSKESNRISGHASIVKVDTEFEEGGSKIARSITGLAVMKDPLIPKDTTVEEVESKVIDWAKDWTRSVNDDRRISGRTRKKFIQPTNYVFMPSNSTSVEMMEIGLSSDEYVNYGKDISAIIFERLWTYGRRTIDELVADLRAIDKNLIIMCVNDLIHQCWLKKYREKGEKIITVELVTNADRKRLLKNSL